MKIVFRKSALSVERLHSREDKITAQIGDHIPYINQPLSVTQSGFFIAKYSQSVSLLRFVPWSASQTRYKFWDTKSSAENNKIDKSHDWYISLQYSKNFNKCQGLFYAFIHRSKYFEFRWIYCSAWQIVFAILGLIYNLLSMNIELRNLDIRDMQKVKYYAIQFCGLVLY